MSSGESGGRYPRPVFRGASHPRCRHHGGTPKDRSGNDPEIIYSAGVRGSAARGVYMPSEFARGISTQNQPRCNVVCEKTFLSFIIFIFLSNNRFKKSSFTRQKSNLSIFTCIQLISKKMSIKFHNKKHNEKRKLFHLSL